MGIIDWLNTNSGVIIAIAAVVLVGIIGYYTYLTWQLLKANNTPEIVVSLRPHHVHVQLVMLCIENIGTGAAHDLQFTTNPTSIPNLSVPFEKIGFLKSGIAYFEPGRKKEFKAALEEWDALVKKIAKPDAQPLSDYAMSRESIYENHPKL